MPEPAVHVSGEVVDRGEGQPGARVLLLAGDLSRSLAVTETAADGSFSMQADTAETEAVLLARLRVGTLGLAHTRLALPHEKPVTLDLAEAGAVHTVAITAVGDAPAQFTLLATPETIPGLPDGVEWTYRIDERTNEAFSASVVEQCRIELQVQEGPWRFSAMHAEGGRVRELGATRSVWELTGARADGASLEYSDGTVRIDVRGPVALELTLERFEQS
jgi:hypothetical protein